MGFDEVLGDFNNRKRKSRIAGLTIRKKATMKLNNLFNDGANYQAQAVACFLKGKGDIEASWNKELHRYEAEIKVARWENCREQGYVVSLKSKDFAKQLNIAFFEHRNSDNICAVKWEQVTINSPTIDTATFGDVYKDKWDVSKEVGCDEAAELADWIFNQLTSFWNATLSPAA